MQNQPVSPASPGGPAPRSLGEVEPVPSEAEGPVQGGGYNAPAVSDKNFIFKHKRLVGFIIILGLLLTAVIVIASSLFFKKPSPDIAAKVGDQEIKVADVENFANDCNVDKKEAVEYLVDDIVLAKWANDEKIAFTKEEQGAEEVRISGKEATINCIAVQAKVNILREKLSQNTEKYREGKFIAVNFGRYANPNPIQITEEATGEADRSQKLQEDRAYADNFASSIYSDLKEGKLNFEQAIEKVDNDPKVGVNSLYDTTFQSGRFTATDYLNKNGLLADDSIRQKIDSLKEGEISEPFIGQINVSPCGITDANCNPQYADARWIIAKVEKIGKGYDESADNILAKIRDKYDAKIYIR